MRDVRAHAIRQCSKEHHLLQAIELRKSYVQQYVSCLQDGKMGGDEKVQEMDAQLNEHTILVFRKLAHAKVLCLHGAHHHAVV